MLTLPNKDTEMQVSSPFTNSSTRWLALPESSNPFPGAGKQSCQSHPCPMRTQRSHGRRGKLVTWGRTQLRSELLQSSARAGQGSAGCVDAAPPGGRRSALPPAAVTMLSAARPPCALRPALCALALHPPAAPAPALAWAAPAWHCHRRCTLLLLSSISAFSDVPTAAEAAVPA